MTRHLLKAGLIAGLALAFQIARTQIEFAQEPGQQPPPATAGAQQGARGGGQRGRVDPRVQERTYVFKETNEFIPYAVFVSSKVRKDKKNPLIVALHGLGGSLNSLLRGNALDLAEHGGYILV